MLCFFLQYTSVYPKKVKNWQIRKKILNKVRNLFKKEAKIPIFFISYTGKSVLRIKYAKICIFKFRIFLNKIFSSSWKIFFPRSLIESLFSSLFFFFSPKRSHLWKESPFFPNFFLPKFKKRRQKNNQKS